MSFPNLTFLIMEKSKMQLLIENTKLLLEESKKLQSDSENLIEQTHSQLNSISFFSNNILFREKSSDLTKDNQPERFQDYWVDSGNLYSAFNL